MRAFLKCHYDQKILDEKYLEVTNELFKSDSIKFTEKSWIQNAPAAVPLHRCLLTYYILNTYYNNIVYRSLVTSTCIVFCTRLLLIMRTKILIG